MTIGATPQHALSISKQVYPTQSQQDHISLDADSLLRLFLAEIKKSSGALERLLHRKQEMDLFGNAEDLHEWGLLYHPDCWDYYSLFNVNNGTNEVRSKS